MENQEKGKGREQASDESPKGRPSIIRRFFLWVWTMVKQFLMKFGNNVDSLQSAVVTENIETESLPTVGSADDTIIPQLASKETSQSAVLVKSPSMNLLDDTAQHLHDLMKLPDTSVSEACNCAKQLYLIMRLKLDAIKTQKSIGGKQ